MIQLTGTNKSGTHDGGSTTEAIERFSNNYLVVYEKNPNMFERLNEKCITVQKGPRSSFDNKTLRKFVATTHLLILFTSHFPVFFDPNFIVSILNHLWEIEDEFYAEHALPHPIYEK